MALGMIRGSVQNGGGAVECDSQGVQRWLITGGGGGGDESTWQEAGGGKGGKKEGARTLRGRGQRKRERRGRTRENKRV
eukprot:scaffold100292_cov29-Tisochrysis_lutea.AAC.2